MDSTSFTPGKIIHMVLKDCYKALKSDLTGEAIEELWSQSFITDAERSKIKSFTDPYERNAEFLKTLKTK